MVKVPAVTSTAFPLVKSCRINGVWFTIALSSEQVHATIQRGGQIEAFEQVGELVLADAYGSYIGQWVLYYYYYHVYRYVYLIPPHIIQHDL